jgi:NADH:ubiquinone oxidoreductase subunit E
MAELRKIVVCQNVTCQDKGSKGVLQQFQTDYDEQYREKYPDLKIEAGDCNGDCEQGPIVKINDALLLRGVDTARAKDLLERPQDVLGDVMHVLEEDRQTFDRILNGELF